MPDCIFCKIVSGDIPSEKIYEDEETLAFLDIRPVNDGHTIIIPKKHHKNVFDIPEKEWLAVMKTVHRIAPAVMKAVGAEGVNIHSNNEPASGQSVFHSHAHIIPRFAEDGYELWPQREYAENQAREVGAKIRGAL